jgi:CheY-like chemotaxis protein
MLHLFEAKIQEKNLKLIKEYDGKIPDVLVGDPVRLHQIILNLVSNAVKFTSKGKILVRVHLIDEEDEIVKIEFSVIDTGIGIANNKIDKIFENFQQASSGTTRLYGGTGLGLAIARQLVETQKGSITVKSKINEGSNFSFILPFMKTNAEANSIQEIVELDPEITNIKVLVAEDIALNQLLMRTLLDDFGFDCDIADNGLIAIEKLKTKSYDIVLMDLQMPEMNGFEATEYIRKTLKITIPIIALTADVTTVDLAKCRSVGMNDYIAKPVDDRLLYSKIVGLAKKQMTGNELVGEATANTTKITDMGYLNKCTKNNSALMMEMINLYLEQTPPLVTKLEQSLLNNDWDLLGLTIHKMIPSFNIMGFHKDYEDKAKKIQEYARNQKNLNEIPDLVSQITKACALACEELNESYNLLKKNTND